tara:strand:+ start:14238 stop:14768 length:531 start_codon:yes stop_codon:yes gene_type:complete
MNKRLPEVFVLDVDGVLTSGAFFYTEDGKKFKSFGPDDNDALSLLNKYIEIRFVTGDKKGFPISKKRVVDDMGYKLDVVSTIRRVDWIEQFYKLDTVIYMGDGIFDHYVMKKVLYSIAPNNADANAQKFADYITKRNGGDRAVSEACLHLLKKFFVPYDLDKIPDLSSKSSGEWTV